MKKINRAESLRTNYSVANDEMRVFYEIDSSLTSVIAIRFPFYIEDQPKILVQQLAFSVSVILASLALPKCVKVDFSIASLSVYKEILQIIYNIRGLSECGEPVSFPEIVCSNKKESSLAVHLHQRRAVLCWSGGLDSTASYLLLKNNGYTVDLVNSDVNQDQAVAESVAVAKLSDFFQVHATAVRVDFPELKRIGRLYSKKFAVPPSYNSIPFGRDLLHLGMSMIVAHRQRARYICFGFEREVWNAQVAQKSTVVPRHELQSAEGCRLMDQLVKLVHSEFGVFSPVSSLSKLSIYNSLHNQYNPVLGHVTSCYFGNNCGSCVNCVLYEVLKKMAGGKRGNMQELEKLLGTTDTVEKETFSDLLLVYFYDVLKVAIADEKKHAKIRAKFGEVTERSFETIKKELLAIKKTGLVPPDFGFEFGNS